MGLVPDFRTRTTTVAGMKFSARHQTQRTPDGRPRESVLDVPSENGWAWLSACVDKRHVHSKVIMEEW